MADEDFTPEELELLDQIIADLKAINRRLSNNASAGEKNSGEKSMRVKFTPFPSIQSDTESLIEEQKYDQIEDPVDESLDPVKTSSRVKIPEAKEMTTEQVHPAFEIKPHFPFFHDSPPLLSTINFTSPSTRTQVMADRLFPNPMPKFVPKMMPSTPQEQQDVTVTPGDSLSKLLTMPHTPLSESLKHAALDLKETIVIETWGLSGQHVGDFTPYCGLMSTKSLLVKSYQVTRNVNDLTLCSQIVKACDAVRNSLAYENGTVHTNEHHLMLIAPVSPRLPPKPPDGSYCTEGFAEPSHTSFKKNQSLFSQPGEIHLEHYQWLPNIIKQNSMIVVRTGFSVTFIENILVYLFADPIFRDYWFSTLCNVMIFPALLYDLCYRIVATDPHKVCGQFYNFWYSYHWQFWDGMTFHFSKLPISIISRCSASSSKKKMKWVFQVASICCALVSIGLWNLIAKTGNFKQLIGLDCILIGFIWISFTLSLLVQRHKWIAVVNYICGASICVLVSAIDIEILFKERALEIFDMIQWLKHFLLLFRSLQNLGYFVSQTVLGTPILSEPLLAQEVEITHTGPTHAFLLSKLFFSWVNSLLSLGYSKPLDLEDIPSLVFEYEAGSAYQKFMQAWEPLSRERSKNNIKNMVLWSVVWDIFIARTDQKHSEAAAFYTNSRQSKVQEMQKQQEHQSPISNQKMQLLLQRQAQQHQQNSDGTPLVSGSTGSPISNNPLIMMNRATSNAMATQMYVDVDRLKPPLKRDVLSEAAIKHKVGGNVDQLLDRNHASLLVAEHNNLFKFLLSAVELWLVAEHNKRGFEQQWLSLTFSKSIFLGNGLVAIVFGLFGNVIIDTLALGPVTSLEAASSFLAIGMAVILSSWTTNYGDSSENMDLLTQFRGAAVAIASKSHNLEDKVIFKGEGNVTNAHVEESAHGHTGSNTIENSVMTRGHMAAIAENQESGVEAWHKGEKA